MTEEGLRKGVIAWQGHSWDGEAVELPQLAATKDGGPAINKGAKRGREGNGALPLAAMAAIPKAKRKIEKEGGLPMGGGDGGDAADGASF